MKELFLTALGIALFSRELNGNHFRVTMEKFIPFKMDAENVARLLIDLEKDPIDVNSTTLQQFHQLIKELVTTIDESIVIVQRHLHACLSAFDLGVKLRIEGPTAIKERLDQIRTNLPQYLPVTSKKELDELFKQVAVSYSRLKVQQESLKRDRMIIHAVNTADDLNSTFNLVSERVIEWYGLHFPELEELVRDHYQYLTLVANIGHRDNFNNENLSHLSEKRRELIISQARTSIGGDIHPQDLSQIQSYARIGLEMKRYQRQLENYIADLMEQVAPNIKALVGAVLGSKLIAKAGGLENLAKMPSSRIQVLGAEKAVFLHLRHGTKPPKHGLIYQDARIHGAPKYLRGKIARAVANKLAIAARLDYFSSGDRGEELARDLEDRIEQIKKQFPKPPKKKKAVETSKKRPSRRHLRKGKRSGKDHRRFKDRQKQKGRGRKKR